MALPFLSCPDCNFAYDTEPYLRNCPVIHQNRLSCLDCKKDEQQVAEFLCDFLKQPNLRQNRELMPIWEALGPLNAFSCRSCKRELSPVGAEPYIFEGCYHLTCRSCDTSKCACGFSYGWAYKCGLEIFEKVGRFRTHEAKLAARQKDCEQGIIAQLKKAKPECAICGFSLKTPLVAMTCEHVVCIQCREDVRHLDDICDVCRKPKDGHMAWGQKLLREEAQRVADQEKAVEQKQEKFAVQGNATQTVNQEQQQVAAQETGLKTLKQEQEKAAAYEKKPTSLKEEQDNAEAQERKLKAMKQSQKQWLAQIELLETEIRKRAAAYEKEPKTLEEEQDKAEGEEQQMEAMKQAQRQYLAQIGMIEMEIRKRLSKISQDSGFVEDDEKPEADPEFHAFRAELQRLADTIDGKKPEPEVGSAKARPKAPEQGQEKVAVQGNSTKPVNQEQQKVAAQETGPKTLKQVQEKAATKERGTKAIKEAHKQYLAQIGLLEVRKKLSKISQDSGVVEDDEKPEADSELHVFRAVIQRLADTIDGKKPEPEVGSENESEKAPENELGFNAPRIRLPAEVLVDGLTKEVSKLRTELDELKLVIELQALEQVKIADQQQRQQVPTKSGIRTLKETCLQKIIEVKKAEESAGESDHGDFEVLNLRDLSLATEDRINNI